MNIPNDDLLAKIHKVTLHILLAFDKVCRENDLTYFLDSGTALGAVRHGGFIPWDDDVDVGMPRKDYERFLEIAHEKLPEEFFLQIRETDPAYKRNAAKLRLKGTVFQEYDTLPYVENGFFIDIFPFDNIPRNRCTAKIYINTLRFFNRINGTRGSYCKSRTRILRMFQKIVIIMPPKLMEWLDEKCLNLCRLLENNNTGFITPFFWGMSFYQSYIFDAEKMFPVKDILFEGHSVRIMQNPDYYLRTMYGDYMQLPPVEKRKPKHLKGVIDFGKYA